MEKYIISDNGGGIGNRFKGLISILRLSEHLGREPLLHWPKNVLMGCDFNKLFDYKIKEISKEEVERIKKEGDSEIYRDWLDNRYVKNKYLVIQCWRFLMKKGELQKRFAKVYPTMKGNNIDFEYGRVPEEVKQDVLKWIKKVEVKQDILKQVDEFYKKNNIVDLIGIHLRRTDFKQSPDGRGEISTDESLFQKIDEILKKNPNQKFFLCTDSKETENLVKNKYKDKIIIYPKTKAVEWDMTKPEASRCALIEVLLLSKTKKILGTYLSTFTELAWWFGNCKQEVETIGDEKIEQKKQVIKNLSANERGLKGLYKRLKIIKYNLRL